MSYELKIKDLLKTLPDSPGVYQFFDINGTLLYVGKAKNIKKRVSSYFTKEVHDSNKTAVLVKKVYDVKYIVVNSELDALLLENNLIKQHQPRYNINLKDDKTYPWICIKNERFPRIFPTRNPVKDGSQYYGPYASVKMMHTLLDLVRQLFPLRNCSLNLSRENIDNNKFKVCLEYHIKNCKGPCQGYQDEEEYNQSVEQIRQIIKGNINSVLRHLKSRMNEYASNYDFEKAEAIRSKIEILERYQSKSTVVSSLVNNVDVCSIGTDEESGFVNYLRIVDGAVVQGYTLELKKRLDESPVELLQLALAEFAGRFGQLSREVIVPFDPEIEVPGVTFTVPQRGDKKQLLELSERNVKFFILEKRKQEQLVDPERHTKRILETMMKDLRMKVQPRHIECFDNSNIQGTNAVAACVVFKDARPSKKDYRHFNIKTVEGPDDFASMKEIVFRRYKRILEENQPLPDLIVIDGGKGQLGAALESLEELGLRGKVTVISIAKKLEEIYFPGDPYPMYLDKKSETLKVIQNLRNEAHRFGITHHRNKRAKSSIKSALDDVPGVGPATAELLLKEFKSVKRIREAAEKEIAAVIGPAKARVLVEYFAKG